MNTSDIINLFIKISIINAYMYFILVKIINFKENSSKKKIIIVFSSIVFSVAYILMSTYLNSVFMMVGIYMIYFIYTIEIKRLLKEKLYYCSILIHFSFVLTYFIYLVSLFLALIALLPFSTKINYNSTIIIIIVLSLMIIIYYILNKTKRLKDGINFLKNKEEIEKISKISNFAFIICIIVLDLPHNPENYFFDYIFMWIIVIGFFNIIYWIRSQITKYYKKDMKDRTIEVQKLEIDEKEKIIEDIKTENLKLAEVVHKYNNRLSAIEMAMEEAIDKNMNTEIAKELSIVLDETKELATSFARESTVAVNSLPLTNIAGIDNMFKYMQKEAIKNNISFDLKLNNSIQSLIENIIPKDKFETILGDHIRDAIIAINYSKNKYRNILVTLGIVENYYELSIYDTGIEFKIETLLNLGKERITTHKESGGSGIGFMTTFETLRKAKASLIIEEYNPKNSSYTKSVNIRFDGKNQYSIYSYRAKEIKNLNKDKKVVIKDL